VGAEHATAEKVNAPAEAREQELPQEEVATTEEGRILQLQRQFGNRAVTALLRGDVTPAVQRASSISTAVQRVISFDQAKLGGRSLKERVKTTFMGADTFGKIANAFGDYQSASTDADKLLYADAISGLTDHWLSKYRADPKQGARRNDVTVLGREAKSESRKLRRKQAPAMDQAYLNKIDVADPTDIKNPMIKKKQLALDPAEELAAGRTTTDEGAKDAALKLVTRYKLTAAEIAAIRIFTMPDYTYINPAIAGSESWLASNIQGTKDPELKKLAPYIANGKYRGNAAGWQRGLRGLMSQGSEHGTRMLQALLKLDPYAGGMTFRGERLTPDQFKAKYRIGGRVPFDGFSSAAKERSIGERYAVGRGVDITPRSTQNVSVLIEAYVKTARDISQLSVKGDEKEVVILPGTKFKILDVRPISPPHDKGDPPATEFYEVSMREE